MSDKKIKQEPAAWYYAGSGIEPKSVALSEDLDDEQKANCVPLYAAPLQAQHHEPVAWMYLSDLKTFETEETTAIAFSIEVGCPKEISVPLYTAPPRREWVGLTDEERADIRGRVQVYMDIDDVNYGKHIQIATEEWLKEKNHD